MDGDNFLIELAMTSLFFFDNFKENTQFVQKVTFELLMDFKQNHYGYGCSIVAKLEKSRNFFFF